ncbi:MAG: Ig-like domain-containing protein, partial [Alistipes sp.]|nr:Ig-like domain-containing protein [Alistipes sp.]
HAAGSVEQTVTFSSKPESVEVGKNVTVAAIAKTTVTYSSSNAAVATIDANTGVVTGVAEGTVTITATAAAEGIYKQASATYTLTVEAAQSGGGVVAGTYTFESTNNTPEGLHTLNEYLTCLYTKVGNNSPYTYSFRVYKGDSFNISATNGAKLKSITFNCDNSTYAKACKGGTVTLDAGTVTTTTSSNNVTFTFSGNVTSFTIKASSAQFRAKTWSVSYE